MNAHAGILSSVDGKITYVLGLLRATDHFLFKNVAESFGIPMCMCRHIHK